MEKRYFPHQLSFLIDNPIRRLFITPQGMADRMLLCDSSRVLEVGPGSGYFSVELARRVPRGRLDLLDLQAEMLVKARRKLESAGLHGVGYVRGDARDLPFGESAFDRALLVTVIGEVPDAPACVRSLYRVLRRGGVACFHEQRLDPDMVKLPALRALVEGGGFDFVRALGHSWNYTALFRRPEGSGRIEGAAG